MEDFRSKSCGDGKMQMETYTAPTSSGMYDLRSYSTSHTHQPPPPPQLKKSKTGGGGGSSSSKGWSLSDPELQRKKRVASYKVYAVEGKMKGGFRKSFRWLKDRYTQVVYGWR